MTQEQQAENQKTIFDYQQSSREFAEAEQFESEFICGECDSPLVIRRDNNAWVAACREKEHTSFARARTTSEIIRTEGGPTHTVDTINRRFDPSITIDMMARIWKARHPKLSKGAAYQAAMFSLGVGLDPRASEIAVMEFRASANDTKENKVPQVMITARGWRTLAGRDCKHLIEAPPVLTPIRDKDEIAFWGGGPSDYVAIAQGYLKADREGLPPRIEPGIYTADEAARDAKSAYKPGGKWPLNQAFARAERKFYERNVPEAIEIARAKFNEAMGELDAGRASRAIALDLDPEREFSLEDDNAPNRTGQTRDNEPQRSRDQANDEATPDVALFEPRLH